MATNQPAQPIDLPALGRGSRRPCPVIVGRTPPAGNCPEVEEGGPTCSHLSSTVLARLRWSSLVFIARRCSSRSFARPQWSSSPFSVPLGVPSAARKRRWAGRRLARWCQSGGPRGLILISSSGTADSFCVGQDASQLSPLAYASSSMWCTVLYCTWMYRRHSGDGERLEKGNERETLSALGKGVTWNCRRRKNPSGRKREGRRE